MLALLPGCTAALTLASLCPRIEEQHPPRPAFSFLRQNEDWSGFRSQVDASTLDRIKHVPLNEAGDVWASFGGRAWVRAEAWDDFAFGAAPRGARTDDVFVLERLLLHGDFHFGDRVRLFLEGKHASTFEDRELAGGNRTLDVDNLDLQQAFVDLELFGDRQQSFTLRTGRQMLQFGQQRLVSPLPWGNTLRAWDGVNGILRHGEWTVSTFWTVFAPTQKHDFNDGDADDQLAGVYAQGKLPGTNAALDLYALWNRRDRVTINGTTGVETRTTLGVRSQGRNGELDGEIEAALQFGAVGRDDVFAGMLTLEGGCTLASLPATPRVFGGFDYASGDRNAGGDVQTFHQLFPLGHAFLGWMDYIGRQNIVDLSAGIDLTPAPGTTARLAAHSFWLVDDDDALYAPNGAPLRGAPGGNDRHVGVELDAKLRHAFRPGLVGEVGYGHFFARETLSRTGPSRGSDFFYLSAQFTF